MKIAILGNSKPGYISIMMSGLCRMLAALKTDTVIFPYGVNLLSQSSGAKGLIKNACFIPYMSRAATCDAIIVINHLADAFRPSLMIERLRQLLPDKPIILYDLVYLPTVGLWGPWLDPDDRVLHKKIFGLDRYDWYLCVSLQNRCPMPQHEQPCSQIGIHLNDGSLFPEQKNRFRALVDFERAAYPQERKLQLEALEETETEYTILSGRYSITDIRAIYRTCSIYFLAHMESFGLPICELQACGCRIMTPYAHWCDAHRLPSPEPAACNRLPPGFVVYENDKSRLVGEINRLKRETSPQQVIELFRQHHEHFYSGNLNALQGVLDRIGRRQIASRSHLQYGDLMSKIQQRPGD